MFEKLSQFGRKLLNRASGDEHHAEVKDVHALLSSAVHTVKPAAGAQDRIREMLKQKHAEIAEQPTLKHVDDQQESRSFNLFALFNKNKFAYGLGALALLLITMVGSYPLVPPPKVQGYSVRNAVRQIPYNAPFKVVFNQPMNRGSVEDAFTVTPAVPGRFEWSFNTLLYWPDKDLPLGERYTVHISEDAKSFIGKNMTSTYQEVFEVIKAPEIVFYTPSGVDSVEKDAKITLMFNQPVLKLTTLTRAESQIPDITIEPSIKGRWRWLGTSSLQFLPDEGLAYGTTYTVTVPAGIKTASEGQTDESTVFSFTTVAPRLINAHPTHIQSYNAGGNGVYTSSVPSNILIPDHSYSYGPNQKITLTFNQKVDLDSLRKKFSLYIEDQSIPFTARYMTQQEYVDALGLSGDIQAETPEEKEERVHTVIIIPKNPLPLNTAISYRLESGYLGTEGPNPATDEYKGAFYTAAPLSVEGFDSYKDYGIIRFNNEVNSKDVKKYIRISPTEKDAVLEVGHGADEDSVSHYVSYPFKPGKTYTVTLLPGITDLYDQGLRSEFSTSFTIPDMDPYFDLRTNYDYNVLDYNREPEFFVKGVNVKFVDYTLTQITNPSDFNQYNSYDERPVASWRGSFKGLRNQVEYQKISLNSVFGKKLAPGIYHLTTNPSDGYYYGNPPSTFFIISRSSLAYKFADGTVLIWATDLETGQPIQNMQVSVTDYYGNNKATGVTNAEGIAEIELPNWDKDSWFPSITAVGTRGDDVAMVMTNWQDGIDSWNFNIDGGLPRENYGYVYTERPIYRPGDTVFFKGIIRHDSGLRFMLPKQQNIRVKVIDPLGKEVMNTDVRVSRSGTINNSFTLDESAAVGEYLIEASLDDSWSNRFTRTFSVAEYRKPEFKLSLEPEKQSYTNGETFNVGITGEYFFGAALKNAAVDITITAQSYYFNNYTDDWYNFGTNEFMCFWECPNGGSEIISTIHNRLDENGKFTLNYKPQLQADDPSKIYTIEATVTDKNAQSISNRVFVPVHKGTYYVGIRPGNYVYSNTDKVEAQVISVDKTGAPVADKKVTMSLVKREWTSVKKKNVDGDYYYENDYQDEVVETDTVRTDQNGKASAFFDPIASGGSYVIKAESTDELGNTLVSTSYVYITSSQYISWGRDNNDRIELVTDKLTYQPGDTARILIKSPYAGVKALVTVERGDILSRQIIDIPTHSHTIEIPITEDYMPNAYVSVLLVKGGGSKESINLKLTDAQKQRDQLLARQKSTEQQINDNITTYGNNPPELEALNTPLKTQYTNLTESLTLLNDEIKRLEMVHSSLSDTADNNDGLASFKLGYAELRVDTAAKKLSVDISSNKSRYLPGEQVTLDVITKDYTGKPVDAEVSVSVVDESVLSLKETVIHDLIGYFYMRRPLGVDTSHSLVKFLNRINVQVESGLKGGGGGLAKRVRSEFKDTAYWNATVNTKNGKATMKFTLPDNLTTWQVLAIAVTDDTKLGSQKMDFVVNKDLLLRPVTPRFFTINDELEIGLISHNTLDKNIGATVSLVTDGVTLMNGDAEKHVSLYAEQDEKTLWKVKVNPGKTAKLIFKVEDDSGLGIRDEVVINLPVYPYTYPEVVATSGSVSNDKNSVVESVFIPTGIDPEIGELQVSVAATFLGSVAQGLEYLVTYPYGCAEQTASGLLPNLVIKQVLSLPQIDNNLINLADLDQRVEKGLQRLYGYQQASGGFGLWQESDPTTHLTAYILYTLYQAQLAGYSVDPNVMVRAEQYLYDSFYHDGDLHARAYALFVLSEVGTPDIALMNNLYDQRDVLNLTGKAYLGLAMSTVPSLKQKAINLTNDILSYQAATSRGVHFEEKDPQWKLFDSDAKLNAAVLRLLARLLPENSLIDKMLREIRYERMNANWYDTHASSQTLLALLEYLRDSGEFDTEFFAKVIVNGGEKIDTAFFKKENFGEIKTVTLPLSELLSDNQENEVMITRNGTGKIYYDMVLKYFLPIVQLIPREEGFSISHNYFGINDDKKETPLSTLPFGETIKGTITLVVPENRHYVVVEDRLPAALEAIDFTLNTSQQSVREYVNPWENNLWAFNHSEIRDDRVLFFSDYLPAGVYELTYYARVTSQGKFADLPVKVEQMYHPETFARTGGQEIIAQ